MDLIGGVKYLENRLGERRPNQGKRKAAQKNAGGDAVGENHAPAPPDDSSTECDTQLGRKVDTTA
jgi:hypothetical protein